MPKGYLIDMDGVIYRGSRLVDGAARFVEQLQASGTPFLFLTNNSARSPKDLVAKLAHLGLKLTPKHFYTAAHNTADFLVRQQPNCRAFVIGEGGLNVALEEAGIAFDAMDPHVVVVGEGRLLNYESLEVAVRLLAKGARLVATNPDPWCPTDAGPRPGTGAYAALLESASGRKAYYLGKPNPFMFLMGRQRLGLHTTETIMIGDTMETDVRGAIEIGIQAFVVLTGSTRREDLSRYAYQPTRVLDSIGDLVDARPSADADGCGLPIARETEVREVLEGSGQM
jgi:NagD protein